MDDMEIIKQALSYDLGSDLHDVWREPRKLDDGSYEPRIKESKDKSWNAIHGTNKVDIANCSFEELPSNWQYENLEAAKVSIQLVFDKVMSGESITPEEKDKDRVHIESAINKVNEYIDGKIDVNRICEQYGLSSDSQSL